MPFDQTQFCFFSPEQAQTRPTPHILEQDQTERMNGTMGNQYDQLRSSPEAKQLLENQEAIKKVLSSPDTKKLLQQLQKKDSGKLQAAAQSALQGDSAALSNLVRELSGNPEAARAMEHLNQRLTKK